MAGEAETLELADRALRTREEHLGPHDPLVADSLVAKANILYKKGDFSAVETLELRALGIYQEAVGSADRRVGLIHQYLGKLYRQTNRLEEAKRQYEDAIEIFEIASGPDSLDVTVPLHGLANVLADSGDQAEAEALYERALAIREAELEPRHPDLAQSYHSLGYLKWELGMYQEARPLMEQAVAIREEVLGPEHPKLADSLNNLALLLWFIGEPGEAEETYLRTLKIWDRHPSPRSAPTLAMYAKLLGAQGDLISSRQYRERAIAVIEEYYGSDHPWLAWTLTDQASLLVDLGEYEQARRSYERSAAIIEKSLGAEHESLSGPLMGLAQLAVLTGDPTEAKQLSQHALELREQAWDGGHPSVAEALRGHGKILKECGDYSGARIAYQRALEIDEKAFGGEANRVQFDLNRLADLSAELEDCQTALPLYRRAVSILVNEGGPDNPGALVGQLKVAHCLARTGNLSEAFETAVRAEQGLREKLRLNLAGLAERVGLQYAGKRESGLDLIYSLLLTDLGSGSVESAYDAMIRSRALVLDEMAERHKWTTTGPSSNNSQLAQSLIKARNRLAFLAVQGPRDPGEVDRHQDLLGQARDERDQAERKLAESNLAFRARLEVKAAGLDEIKVALPTSSGILSLVRFHRIDLHGDGGTGKDLGEPWYIAFVLRSDGGRPVLVPLGRAAEIDELVEQFRRQVADVSKAPAWAIAEAERQFRSLGSTLRARVWDPIASHVEGLKALFIVPDGELNIINFSALPSEDGSYLIESRPILHYLSAERDLVGFGTEDEGRGLLAIGDPAFDEAGLFAALAPEPKVLVAETPKLEESNTAYYRGSRSACGSFQTLEFQELPATERELREISELWQEAGVQGEGGSQATESAVRLTQAAASEAEFKAQSAGRRVIHIATHGFFLGGKCPSALDAEETPALADSQVGENPLLLAGLALAGSNHRDAAAPGEEDGILTAEEIAALDLSGVEWAVLSACDTGIGEVRAGEGVFGLRRAFQIAGVDTLIMSLWRVGDDPTREWMNLLYESRFIDGRTTSDAVHLASLGLLQRRRGAGLSTHPFYWAGFVAAGDWR